MTTIKARVCILGVIIAAVVAGCSNHHVIEVSCPTDGSDATLVLQTAIDSAARVGGDAIIRLQPCEYHISRAAATERVYHISNTASRDENPDPTKHVGLWLCNLRDITLEGNGATLVTHGEMTPIVIDSCHNVTLRNFTLTAGDPSVPEFVVMEVSDSSAVIRVVPPSDAEVRDGRLYFIGDGWAITDDSHEPSRPHHAQIFYADRNVTLRCESPLSQYGVARNMGNRMYELVYGYRPDLTPGHQYQVRHGIRNEVCGLINRSSDVTVENVEFNFMGNFGLVGQFSENVTYDNIRCRPAVGSERTNAGFADFVQMSGCRGKVKIMNSYFEGAQDDPINIHGTHLQVVDSDGERTLKVRYMHGQTFGFDPFSSGDSIEIVDRHTLVSFAQARLVTRVERLNDYEYLITIDSPLPPLPDGYSLEDLAVENITWTPAVEIRNNFFARTPTRGILLTTRRESLIEGNTFYRIPMPAILVSDDARSWYESGLVRSLTIRDNRFIECTPPVIEIKPEIDRYGGAVHQNIVIADNDFILTSPHDVIALTATDNVVIRNNNFVLPVDSLNIKEVMSLIDTTLVNGLSTYGNRVTSP